MKRVAAWFLSTVGHKLFMLGYRMEVMGCNIQEGRDPLYSRRSEFE